MQEELDEAQLPIGQVGPPWWKTALKWACLLPGSIVAYYFATILNNWGASYYDPDIVHDMMGTGGFSGHYILGPVYIFHTRAIAAGAFCAFAVWLAPSHKKIVFGVYCAFYVLWLLALVFLLGMAFNQYGGFRWEPAIRLAIELIAAGLGVVLGGLATLEGTEGQPEACGYRR
jgi:hypothetical protein